MDTLSNIGRPIWKRLITHEWYTSWPNFSSAGLTLSEIIILENVQKWQNMNNVSKWPHSVGRHFHALRLLRSVLITFDHPGREYILAEFQLCRGYAVWVYSFWKCPKMTHLSKKLVIFNMAAFRWSPWTHRQTLADNFDNIWSPLTGLHSDQISAVYRLRCLI